MFHFIAFDHRSSRGSDRKIAIIDTAPPISHLISLRNISLPFNRFTASVNRLRLLSHTLSALSLTVISAIRIFGRELRHISNVILAGTMRLPRVKCLCRRQALPLLHHTILVPLGGVVSCHLPRLATNYTLMRRRVIRRRCTKWKR